MEQSFPRTLALLRKERGLSQKEAAASLGISQSLLSHYEKGIRECGHAFLVKTAEFYGVSIDFLLGVTSDRQGAIILAGDIPEPDAMGKGDISAKNMYVTLNKKLISNTINIIFGYLSKIDENELTSEVSSYIMLSLYDIVRLLHGANKENEDVLFGVPREIFSFYTDAAGRIAFSNINAMLEERRVHGKNIIRNRDAFVMNSESIKEEYTLFSSSLFNLIKQVEQKVLDETSFGKNDKK